MKILIGVLHTIENEYEACINAIKNQTYKDWEIFTLRDLPNKLANDTLFATFMNRSKEFDLFIRVDADMVIQNKFFFENIVEFVSSYPENDLFLIPVQDYLTGNRLVIGMHIWRNTVTWNLTDDELFVDRVVNVNNPMRIANHPTLVPAALHNPNPSKFQAFHFGLHKAIKSTQYGISSNNKKEKWSYDHLKNVDAILEQFLLKKDNETSIFCAMGVIAAIKNRWTSNEVVFSSPRVKVEFERLSNLSKSEQQHYIIKNKKVALINFRPRWRIKLFFMRDSDFGNIKYKIFFVLLVIKRLFF